MCYAHNKSSSCCSLLNAHNNYPSCCKCIRLIIRTFNAICLAFHRGLMYRYGKDLVGISSAFCTLGSAAGLNEYLSVSFSKLPPPNKSEMRYSDIPALGNPWGGTINSASCLLSTCIFCSNMTPFKAGGWGRRGKANCLLLVCIFELPIIGNTQYTIIILL